MLISWQVSAESNRVEFPANLELLVHYTTVVSRGEVTKIILTSREALNAIRDGQNIPNGAQVILADYRDGKIHRYFVMQKVTVGERLRPSRRTDDWQSQWYWPDGSINTLLIVGVFIPSRIVPQPLSRRQCDIARPA